MSSELVVDLVKNRRTDLRILVGVTLVVLCLPLFGVGVLTYRLLSDSGMRGDQMTDMRPMFWTILAFGFSVVVALAFIAIRLLLATRKVLRVDQRNVSLTAFSGSFTFPHDAIDRLTLYQPPGKSGLAGTYSIETRDGTIGRFSAYQIDRDRSDLRELLDTIEQRTGLRWAGRAGASERLTFRAFLRDFRAATGSHKNLDLIRWFLKNMFTVRARSAGVNLALFRWTVPLFIVPLLGIALMLSNWAFFSRMNLNVRVLGVIADEGRAVTQYARQLYIDQNLAPPSEFSIRRRQDSSGLFRHIPDRMYGLVDGYVLVPTTVAVFLIIGWFATCLGVNVMMTLVRFQERKRESLEAEMSAARAVQQRLLPSASPNVPGFEISGACIPANEVGGDYYDYQTLSSGDVAITIADVSGKGLRAGMLMTLTKGALKTKFDSAEDLPTVLAAVNRTIRDSSERGMFVSMAIAKLDPKGGTVKLARAGHNSPLVVRASGATEWLNPSGIALGLNSGAMFEKLCGVEELTLELGDCLVLYTDGVTEAMKEGAAEYGDARLAEIVGRSRTQSAEGIREAILADVRQFRGNAAVNDDLTLVVVGRV